MIEKAVNPRFEDYLFNWNETYQFLVGGYGSSKSYHTALKIILKLLREKRTALVVREVFDTHRDSTFALFEDIIEELELGHAVKAVSSPMQLRFSNGSRIMFKGMDNPAKLKSIHHISKGAHRSQRHDHAIVWPHTNNHLGTTSKPIERLP